MTRSATRATKRGVLASRARNAKSHIMSNARGDKATSWALKLRLSKVHDVTSTALSALERRQVPCRRLCGARTTYRPRLSFTAYPTKWPPKAQRSH
jgi:hypothetical protein